MTRVNLRIGKNVSPRDNIAQEEYDKWEKETMMDYWRKQMIKKQVGKEKPAKVKGIQKDRRRNNPGISGTWIR